MFNEIFNRVVPQAFLAGVTHAQRVASEEIFGPVLSVMTFRTPEEAFERANNIPYGLSAGVWTDKKFSTPHPVPLPVRGGEGEIFQCPRQRRLGEHLQQVRPDKSVRRRPGKRL